VTTGERYDKLLVTGGGILFILANALLMLGGFYYLPVVVLIPVVLYLAFFSFNGLFMAVVFLTPLSVELSRLAGDAMPFDISIPTEPLIVIMILVVLMKMIHSGTLSKDIIYHPLSLAIIFYLVWLFITTLTSTMPLVSLKYLVVRLGYISLFYFVAISIFKKPANIRTFMWCYIAGLALVAVITLVKHSGFAFESHRAANMLVRPFYNDHTAYGAALAMFIPILGALTFRGSNRPGRWYAWALLGLFAAALLFSYSRAAWLSVLAALAVWIIILFKIKFSTLITFSVISAGIVIMLWHDIERRLERNTQDSSADMAEHVQSITNISSDASNLERINRWKAALAMWGEKPLLGWGPGTYMFQYAPFQISTDRTIISTNFADGGDAHSEYLGPLSETGLPGMISFMLVALAALYTGFRLLVSLEKRKDRILVTGVLLGLVTYLMHGFLNNFLHSDKSAVPFWGFAAILVVMDLYGKKSPRLDPGLSGAEEPPSITG
jgi:putative inorganic carbon (hco3(-)) transporter